MPGIHQQKIFFLLAFCAVLMIALIVVSSAAHADLWHFLSSFNASTAVMSPHS